MPWIKAKNGNVVEVVDDDLAAKLVREGSAGPFESRKVAIAAVTDRQQSEDGGRVPLPDGEPTDKWTGAQLKQYAADHDIDLGGATRKADILAAITAGASTDGEDDEDPGEDDES